MKTWMIFLSLFLLSAAMAADSPQVHFTAPDGWRRVEKNDVILLVPPDLPAGKTAVLMVLAPQDFQGTFADWFKKQWGSFQKTDKLIDGGEMRTEPAGGNAPELMYTAGRVEDKAGNISNLFFFAARSGNKAYPYVYMSNTDGIPDAHQLALSLFVKNLTFGDVRSPAQPPAQTPPLPQRYAGSDMVSPSFTWGEIPPPKGTTGLSGLYVTQNLVMEQQQSVVTGQRVSEPVHQYWAFFPDGRCYNGLPDEGLLNFNYEYMRKINSLFTSTYTLNGDHGTIVWGDGTSTIDLRREGDKLVLTDKSHGATHYVMVDPCNGLKLNGTYKRYDYQAQYSPREGITFTPDGHFEDQGLLKAAGALWRFVDRGFISDNGAPGRGTYRIENNTLELIYTDGRKKRINFTLDPQSSKANPDKFLVNTWQFIRVN